MIVNLLSKLPLLQNYFSGIITIFTLHRVHPFELNKLSSNENMKVSPEFLDKFIVDLKLKGYEFVSLDRVHEILQNGEKVKKQIVFTLDDGYIDNYTHAYPIFKKHNIPFTIYVTTSFPQNEAILWWYVLEDILVNNDEIILENDQKFSCKSKYEKIDVFMNIRAKIISFEQKDFMKYLNQLFSNYEINWQKRCKKIAMSWEQIIELSQDELCTIAGHTKNHYALNRLSESEILDEVIESNKLLELKIGKQIEHFAYPFGSKYEINEREFHIIKNLGFKTATTTRYGTIYLEHKKYLESLPRIMLTENFNKSFIGKIRRNRVVTL